MLRKDRLLLLTASTFLLSLGIIVLYFLYSLMAGINIELDKGIYFLLLIVYGGVCLYPIYRRVLVGNLDIFEPPIWASITYGLAFGILGLPLFSKYVYINPFLDSSYWLNLAFFYIILSIASLWLGYNTKIALWVLGRIKIFHPKREKEDAVVKLSYAFALYAIGLLARIYMINYGLYAYLGIANLNVSSLGLLQIMMHIEKFCTYALAILTISYFIKPSNAKRIMFALIMSLEIIFGFISGMKSHVIIPLLIVAIIYYYTKRNTPKGILIGIILILIVSYPFSDTYRDFINKGAVDTTSIKAIIEAIPDVMYDAYSEATIGSIFNFGYQKSSSRLSMLESFSLIVKDLSQSGRFWYGKYYVYFPLLVLVPRIIWPNKPVIDIGLWFTQTYWNPIAISSTAITYPGDLYLNFGLVGVLLGMFVTGIIYRLVYEWFKLNIGPLALFIYVFIFLALTNYEGDFLGIYTGLIKQLMELIIIGYFVFGKKRRISLR